MAAPSAASEPKLFKVGTLSYTTHQLWILFFWLMWNDFTVHLLESEPQLTRLLMKDHGGTYAQMEIFASIGAFFGIWLNPIVSTWSDRLRSKWGRRRPFLFISAPLFAVSLMAIPYMPDLHDYLVQFPIVAKALSYIPMSSTFFFIGIASFVSGLINAVLLAIFSYYYWDVVPESVLGRFQSLVKIVTLVAGLVWSFFIFGLADTHMKEVYVGVSLFCGFLYILSVIMVKEGEYPPPQKIEKPGKLEMIKVYVKDCYSKPYFLWIFFGFFVYQLSNKANGFQIFYLRDDIHLSLQDIGWSEGWSKTFGSVFGVLFGFWIGSMTDKLKPIRLMPYIHVIWGLICIGGYYYIVDRNTFMIFSCARIVASFAYGIAVGALTVEVFPREKLGQFCSANAFFQQAINMAIGPLVGYLFDVVFTNRESFLWQGVFQLAAAIVFVKIYFNWKKMEKEKLAIEGSSPA